MYLKKLHNFFFLLSSPEDMLIDLERGEWREREKEVNIDMRQKHQSVPPVCAPTVD